MISKKIKLELLNAVKNREVARLGQIIDWLRFDKRMTYAEQFVLAHELTGISEADWDELLYEVDQLSSRS